MKDQAPYGKEDAPADNKRIVCRITITAYADGDIKVTDFPLNVGEAIELLTLAIKAVTDFFIDAAIDGRLKRDQKLIIPVATTNNLN